MRSMLVASSLVLSTAVGGCGANAHGSAKSSDCQATVRFGGATFTEVGYLGRTGAAAGEALLAECHDQGSHAPGSTFAGDADKVRVWAVRGVGTDQVVVRKTAGGLQVFIADGLSSAERSKIMAALGPRE